MTNTSANSKESTSPVDTNEPIQFMGEQISANPIAIHRLLEKLFIDGGYSNLNYWTFSFMESAKSDSEGLGGSVAVKNLQLMENLNTVFWSPEMFIEHEKPLVIKEQIVPMLEAEHSKIYVEINELLFWFKDHAFEKSMDILDANEFTAKAEKMRYGITEEIMNTFSEFQPVITVYDMDKESPAGRGLSGAADILLKRRQAIDNLQREKPSVWDPTLIQMIMKRSF